jgi:hypothetical protein
MTDSLFSIDSRKQNLARILIEFVSEEAKLGLRIIPCLDIIEKILLQSGKDEIIKKDLVLVYR